MSLPSFSHAGCHAPEFISDAPAGDAPGVPARLQCRPWGNRDWRGGAGWLVPTQNTTGGSSLRTLYLMPHSHIDVEWYWTFATTQEWTKDILDKAMALLRRDPDYRFTQDQVVLLKSYWEGLGAEDRAFFKQMVAEGRLAIVGGMYVQPEVAEPSGEALVRQILVGQQWLAATLGVRARCGWFIDTFGQVPQLPQILRQAGYDAYVFWRDIPLDYPIASLPADFYCESPDGTRILTHWLAGGYSFSDAHIQVQPAAAAARRISSRPA